jgi:hypothetical protein
LLYNLISDKRFDRENTMKSLQNNSTWWECNSNINVLCPLWWQCYWHLGINFPSLSDIFSLWYLCALDVSIHLQYLLTFPTTRPPIRTSHNYPSQHHRITHRPSITTYHTSHITTNKSDQPSYHYQHLHHNCYPTFLILSSISPNYLSTMSDSLRSCFSSRSCRTAQPTPIGVSNICSWEMTPNHLAPSADSVLFFNQHSTPIPDQHHKQ